MSAKQAKAEKAKPKKNSKPAAKPDQRAAWFDEATQTSLIADYAQRLDSFLSAVADGRVDEAELEAQESRVVKLMKRLEPQLDDALHANVTELLCEMTAYDIMHAVNIMQEARPKSVFRG
jgi:hypothetical protein